MRLAERVYENLSLPGPVVILLHPIGTSKDVWEPVLKEADLSYPAIALDLPGHGQSDYLQAFSMENTATDVLDYIDNLNRDVVVVGHSIGGMVAQHVAARNSDRVKGAVLVSTLSCPSSDAQKAMQGRAATARKQGMVGLLESTLTRWFTPASLSAKLPVVAFVEDLLKQANPRVHAESWEAIASLDTSRLLPEIRVPVLVLVGDEDVTTPPMLSEQIVSGCSQAKLKVLLKVGHALPQEAPARFCEALNEFVGGLQ